MPTHKASGPDQSGDVWVKIDGFTRKYFISRSDIGDTSLIDDEAQLEIEATIQAISPLHKKHLGQSMRISLLSAQKYGGKEQSVTAFFGSLTLRGSQRSALAYLPLSRFGNCQLLSLKEPSG